MDIRVGNGYDIHKLIEGNGLIIGNIKIPFDKKFLAHSDGDVLIHSIIDSFFGALALGDIGRHFPDSDNKYKNIDSAFLLTESINKIEEKGFVIGNIDATVICQKPKLADYIDIIRQRLSQITKIEIDRISIKAKTKEGVDSTGKGESIEVYTTTLLIKKSGRLL